MCVICVKNKNVKFPEEKALRNCWDNNPDMGGFMYAYNNEVYIKKGYMTYEDFSRALNEARKVTGDDVPYVLHFRISTQGYDKDCCQPFPLSEKMKNLRKCKSKASIGVAHNGILSMTSDGAKNYSDTMKFITDYLVDIIRGLDYHKDKRTLRLIERLIDGSRFAILGRDGVCTMLGKGWMEDKPTGLWYSNNSYAREPYSWTGMSIGVHGVQEMLGAHIRKGQPRALRRASLVRLTMFLTRLRMVCLRTTLSMARALTHSMTRMPTARRNSARDTTTVSM